MLEAKFGDRYHDVPALWFWTRFNREKGESKGECKGYIKGGYKHITDTCARVLTRRSGLRSGSARPCRASISMPRAASPSPPARRQRKI
jgi:hypothetical protein